MSNTFAQSNHLTWAGNTDGRFVLLLFYSDRSGLLGAWGPYVSETHAQRAKDELKTWPIQEGIWEIVPLKNLPTASATVTTRNA